MAFDANDLSPHEHYVVDRTRDGEVADFTPMAGPDGAKPSVRAGFLRKLLLQLEPQWHVRMPGVRIKGARIEGVLDLSDCSGAGGAGLPALELVGCDIPEPMDLSHARLARLCLKNSAFTHLRAHEMRLDGPFDFSSTRAVTEDGLCWIDARAATIEGRVEGSEAALCIDGSVARPEEAAQAYALILREAKIGNGVCLMSNFRAAGGVTLFDAVVEGLVDLRGAQLKAVGRRAFNLGNLRAGGIVSLARGFRCEGPIWMRGAVLNGGLNFDGGAVLVKDGETEGVNADNCEIGEDLQMRNGFTCNALVSFVGAQVDGGVSIDKGVFATAQGCALDFRNIVIKGGLEGAAALTGSLCLAGADIGRNLDLRGSEIVASHPRGSQAKSEFATAVDATNLRVGGAAFFKATSIKGEILLADARIEGYLAFGGGRFLNANGWAIRAPNIRVGGNLTLKVEDGDPAPYGAKTVIEGAGKFDRAQIDGALTWLNLELRGAAPGRQKTAVLSFADACVRGAIEARNLMSQDALIDLSGATCAALDDDVRTGWGTDSVVLDFEGFSYGRLEGGGKDDRWRSRLNWLKRARGKTFSPQPFGALAQVYARAGRREDARRVLLEQHDQRTRAAPAGPLTWLLSSLFGLFSGYGFAPIRAVRALLLFLAIGVVGVLAMDAQRALVTPEGRLCNGAIEPALYAIDVALPVIDLGQERLCAPGAGAGSRLYPGIAIPESDWRLFEGVAMWRWAWGLYALFGAILSALAILTFSGVMKPKADD